jgi:malonyl-CoA O-methyltransferase
VQSPTLSTAVNTSAPIELDRVRQLFARPSRNAGADFLQREISARMQERLALVKLNPHRVLDAGCGTGADTLFLKKRYPDTQVIGLDASLPMLAQARYTQQAALSSLQRWLARSVPSIVQATRGADAELVCGDFARLPLAPGAIDLVWSNLALHWHPCPDQVIAEWRRVIATDGLLMFSCFGPDSLRELREASEDADPSARILPFVDMHDYGDMLVAAGFATPVMDMEKITVTYTDASKLLTDVRALGGNPLATRRRGLTGKSAWRRLIDHLERQRRTDGTITLTFEIIYGHAFRPVPKVTARGESIVRLDFPKKPSDKA